MTPLAATTCYQASSNPAIMPACLGCLSGCIPPSLHPIHVPKPCLPPPPRLWGVVPRAVFIRATAFHALRSTKYEDGCVGGMASVVALRVRTRSSPKSRVQLSSRPAHQCSPIPTHMQWVHMHSPRRGPAVSCAALHRQALSLGPPAPSKAFGRRVHLSAQCSHPH